MTPYYAREGVRRLGVWLEVVRYERKRLRQFECYYQGMAVRHNSTRSDAEDCYCDACGHEIDDETLYMDDHELAVVYWMTDRDKALRHLPSVDCHGTIRGRGLYGSYRVRLEESEPWEPLVVIERYEPLWHPVTEYEIVVLGIR